jgi:hypothetical protein
LCLLKVSFYYLSLAFFFLLLIGINWEQPAVNSHNSSVAAAGGITLGAGASGITLGAGAIGRISLGAAAGGIKLGAAAGGITLEVTAGGIGSSSMEAEVGGITLGATAGGINGKQQWPHYIRSSGGIK